MDCPPPNLVPVMENINNNGQGHCALEKKLSEVGCYSSNAGKYSSLIPCDCGEVSAYWHGDNYGRREYCCNSCWSLRNG